MLNYIWNSITKNKFRIGLVFIIYILVITCMEYSTQVLYNASHLIDVNRNNLQYCSDMDNMIGTLTLFLFVVTFFSYKIINNTVGIIISSRMKEFKLLNNLGVCRNDIKKMLLAEFLLVLLLGMLIGEILGIISACIFNYYEFEVCGIYMKAILYVPIFMFALCYFIVSKNYKKIVVEEKNTFKSCELKKGQCFKQILYLLVGIIFVILSRIKLVNIESIKSISRGELESISLILLCIGIIFIFNALTIVLIKLLNIITKVFKLNSMYIATSQNICGYRQLKTIITSLTVAIILIVSVSGLFSSVRESAYRYCKENFHYNYMIYTSSICNKDQEKVKKYIDEKFEDAQISTALSLNLTNEVGYCFDLIGVDDDFSNMENLEYINPSIKNNDIKNSKNNLKNKLKGLKRKKNEEKISEKDKENNPKDQQDNYDNEEGCVSTIFPAKKADDNQLIIGSIIKNYKVNDRNIKLKIEKEYKQISKPNVYTSRSKLSEQIFGNSNMFNTIYVKSKDTRVVDEVINYLNINDYSVKDIETICKEEKDTVVKGTEMVEIFIYVNLIISLCGMVNIFILSFQHRRREYAVLRVIGIKKNQILKSIIFEGVLIYFVSLLSGWIIGRNVIKILINLLNKNSMIEINFYINNPELIAILAMFLLIIVFSIYLIGIKCLKKNYLNYMYKE